MLSIVGRCDGDANSKREKETQKLCYDERSKSKYNSMNAIRMRMKENRCIERN